MNGTVIVRPPTNAPPIVNLTAPSSGAIFAAPCTGQTQTLTLYCQRFVGFCL